MLRPWEAAFLDLHRHVDEMFEELVYRPWAITGRTGWRPPVDLHETIDGYLVVIDLPDVAPEEVRVVVGEREVVVAGQRAAAAPPAVLFQRCERHSGAFERTLKLPQPVDPRRARAEYRRGTCWIHLPKKQPSGPAPQPTTAAEQEARCVLRLTVP